MKKDLWTHENMLHGRVVADMKALSVLHTSVVDTKLATILSITKFVTTNCQRGISHRKMKFDSNCVDNKNYDYKDVAALVWYRNYEAQYVQICNITIDREPLITSDREVLITSDREVLITHDREHG